MVIHNKQVQRAKLIKETWQNIETSQTAFGGLTYPEFCSGIAPSFEAREAYEPKLKEAEGLRQEIDNADATTALYVQKAVNGILCHPEHGPNSPTYVQWGYVAQNQRRTGLTRKPGEEPEPMPTGVA